MASLKKNVTLNFINTAAGIIFPLITFPYAARVLAPEGIGAVQFLNSIVAYVCLLTSLGIPMYAVREVARQRSDKARRDRTTVEITALSVILNLIGIALIAVLGFCVDRVHAHLTLFFILSLAVPFSAIGVNWFYQAIEDFTFITVRGLVFRTVLAACLFLFVHEPDDLLAYGLIFVGSSVGNNFINFVHLRRHIDLAHIPWRQLRVWRHLRPALHIFVLNLITSLYLNLNSVMLGFMQDDTAVGFYASGDKVAHMVLTVVSSVGTVMLPHCAHLLEQGDRAGFAELCAKSMRFMVALALPLMVGLCLLARPVLLAFAGAEFLDATLVVWWTSPIILFIALSNVVGLQVLYPQGKENIVIISTIGAALLNLLLNVALIPHYSYVGAAVSTFAAEGVVVVLQVWVGRRYIPFRLLDVRCLRYVAAVVAMALVVWAETQVLGDAASLVVGIVSGAAVYALVLFLLKDDLFREMCAFLTRRGGKK